MIDLSHEPGVHEAAFRAMPQPPHRLVMSADRGERLGEEPAELIVDQREVSKAVVA